MNQGEDICISLCLFKIAKNFMKIKLFGYCYVKSEFQSSEIFTKIDKPKFLNDLKIEKYINSFFESEKLLYKIPDNTENVKLYIINRLIYSLKSNRFVKKFKINIQKIQFQKYVIFLLIQNLQIIIIKK